MKEFHKLKRFEDKEEKLLNGHNFEFIELVHKIRIINKYIEDKEKSGDTIFRRGKITHYINDKTFKHPEMKKQR